MKINSINQTFNFGAKILNAHRAASKIAKILNKASNYDVFYTNYCNYEKLCKEINEILPNNDDEVLFKNVKSLKDEKASYKVSGNITHNGKNEKFEAFIYCSDGSFIVGKRILNSMKKAAGIKNTDIFNY